MNFSNELKLFYNLDLKSKTLLAFWEYAGNDFLQLLLKVLAQYL